MNRRTAIIWAIEFGSVTAIGVVLSTATATAKWWVTAPAALIIAAKIVEYYRYHQAKMDTIRYQLQILVRLLPVGGARVRCTYHRPIHHKLRNRTDLAQAFDYLPEGGGGGRRFRTDKGIIGKVYCNKGPRVENFSSDQEYRERMMSEYNYKESELKERAADRRSYMCYPIVDENHDVLGLLFLDSNESGTFTLDETNPAWRTIRAAGEVIRSNILASG